MDASQLGNISSVIFNIEIRDKTMNTENLAIK